MNLVTVEKDSVIVREGDPGQSMYAIKSGSVSVRVNYGTERERELTVLRAGGFFGELAMVDAEPRSATVVALEQTELEEILPGEMAQYFSGKPDMLLAIMGQTGRRLRELTRDYIEACRIIRDLEQGAPKTQSLLQKIKHYIAEYDEAQMRAARDCLFDAHLFY